MANSRKKVLMITYYWPPCGGIGVLRFLKTVKYIRQFGWEPIVYTPENAHYPSLDESYQKDIPEGIEVLKQPIWEPYHIYKFFTGQQKDANVNNVFYVKEEKPSWKHNFSVWVRSNFFIPDARAMWIKPSVRFLTAYLKENKVDAILSTGPPHSCHRIAFHLHKKTNIPWQADFRDPWTQIDFFKQLKLTKWGQAKHQRLEQETFKAANKITIVSPTWKKELMAIGAQGVEVIETGFDPDDYADIPKQLDTKFSLTHIGTMGYDRMPRELFLVLKKMIEGFPEFASAFELKLVGQVDYSIIKELEILGIQDNVTLVGAVDRAQALRLMRNSRMVLLLLNQQENVLGRVPGKLFEYLASGRPILNQGPVESDVAKILKEVNRGITHAYNDFEGLSQTLIDYFEAYKNGALEEDLATDISKYTCLSLTEKVAALLDEITR